MANYLSGWKNAQLEVYNEGAYVPIACITSRAEDNTTRTTDRVNVCTQGETQKTVDGFDRSVNFDAEATDQDSYDEFESLFNTGEEQFFKTFKNDSVERFFKGVISSLSLNADASAGVTFNATIDLNGGYSDTDLQGV